MVDRLSEDLKVVCLTCGNVMPYAEYKNVLWREAYNLGRYGKWHCDVCNNTDTFEWCYKHRNLQPVLDKCYECPSRFWCYTTN